MRNLLALVLAAVSLAGCMTTNNVSHKYEATPNASLAGLWVGSATGQTHTMMLRDDGTGEVCWEAGRGYQTMPVKISGEKIISVTESTLKINSNDSFSQCKWGICMDFRRTKEMPAACREWLKS